MAEPVYEYEKYKCMPQTMEETLKKYGVAIIPSVLNKDECNDMIKGMWETLEYITQDFENTKTDGGPIKREDESTWRSFYNLFPGHSMLVQHWGVGHAQYVWNVRQNPKILDIFSKIWKVSPKELLVSFDGVSYHLPPEKTGKGWYKPKEGGWLHSDQSFTRNDFECIQSWVTAFDVNEGDASLVILEGSHLYHKEFSERFDWSDRSDWGKLSQPSHYEFYEKEKGCNRTVIKCPKGSVVLWDSRTIHSGQEPVKTRKKCNFRSVVYLCYTPRYLASPKDLEKKKKYFEEQRMTNHWPHKIKVFGKKPYTRGKSIPNVRNLPVPFLNPIGKYLAGYEPPMYDVDEEGYVLFEIQKRESIHF